MSIAGIALASLGALDSSGRLLWPEDNNEDPTYNAYAPYLATQVRARLVDAPGVLAGRWSFPSVRNPGHAIANGATYEGAPYDEYGYGMDCSSYYSYDITPQTPYLTYERGMMIWHGMCYGPGETQRGATVASHCEDGDATMSIKLAGLWASDGGDVVIQGDHSLLFGARTFSAYTIKLRGSTNTITNPSAAATLVCSYITVDKTTGVVTDQWAYLPLVYMRAFACPRTHAEAISDYYRTGPFTPGVQYAYGTSIFTRDVNDITFSCTPAPPSPPSSPPEQAGLGIGAIIGISAGGGVVLLVIVIIIVVIVCCCKKKRSASAGERASTTVTATAVAQPVQPVAMPVAQGVVVTKKEEAFTEMSSI